jgi:hypothetical protein
VLRGDRLHAPAFVIEHVDAHAAIVRAIAQLAPRDQVDCRVILKHLHIWMQRQRRQQRRLDLAPGHILRMENPPLGVPALLAQIQLAAVTVLAFAKGHAQLDQLLDPRRTLFDNPTNHRFVAKTGAGFERIAHMQVEGVLARSHRRDSTLCIIGIRFRAVLFRNHRDGALFRHI